MPEISSCRKISCCNTFEHKYFALKIYFVVCTLTTKVFYANVHDNWFTLKLPLQQPEKVLTKNETRTKHVEKIMKYIVDCRKSLLHSQLPGIQCIYNENFKIYGRYMQPLPNFKELLFSPKVEV